MIPIMGLGAGGHAKVLIEILRLMGGYELVGLLDIRKELWGTQVLGVPVLGGDELLQKYHDQGIHHAFIGVGTVGETQSRQHLYQKVREHGFSIASAVHPSAFVSPSARMDEGVTLGAYSVVNTSAQLGENVIVNTGAIVEHDCVIGSHSHIATRASLASSVWVGEGAHIGVGASVRQSIRIGEHAIIGAGSAVVHDVSPNVVAVGVPAHCVRTLAPTNVSLEPR
jgi:sugar O-acyltransferase (sialic acid O-acetyltransferase NeuD family)